MVRGIVNDASDSQEQPAGFLIKESGMGHAGWGAGSLDSLSHVSSRRFISQGGSLYNTEL